MLVQREVALSEFEFWAGAVDTVEVLTHEDLATIEDIFSELFYERIPTETEVNDIFWFERDMIAEWLGYDDYEDLLESRE